MVHTSNQSPSFLSLRSVTKQYGGSAPVVDDIHLDIAAHEFVCLLGPSGCGKTTLLRLIAGLDTPSRGFIQLRGQDLSNVSCAARRFGLVFQSYALFPNLTVSDNIAYGLKKTSADTYLRNQKRVSELLDLLGLSAYAQRYPAQLSGGQQQRVALARALAPQPQLLLLDEPLSALDAQVRLHLRGELKRIQRLLGIPTIMVTHDQDEALAIADRVVLMNHGVISQQANPLELYTKPSSAFAAQFLGRLNLWRGVCGAQATITVQNVHFRLNPSKQYPLGSAVDLAIRPEQIQLLAFDYASARLRPAYPEDKPNHTAATISQIVFCGSYYSVAAYSPALGAQVMVEVPSAQFHSQPWALDSACELVFPEQALMVFAA